MRTAKKCWILFREKLVRTSKKQIKLHFLTALAYHLIDRKNETKTQHFKTIWLQKEVWQRRLWSMKPAEFRFEFLLLKLFDKMGASNFSKKDTKPRSVWKTVCRMKHALSNSAGRVLTGNCVKLPINYSDLRLLETIQSSNTTLSSLKNYMHEESEHGVRWNSLLLANCDKFNKRTLRGDAHRGKQNYRKRFECNRQSMETVIREKLILLALLVCSVFKATRINQRQKKLLGISMYVEICALRLRYERSFIS